jgi:hypothetical protein
MKDLEEKGLIKKVVGHSKMQIYSRLSHILPKHRSPNGKIQLVPSAEVAIKEFNYIHPPLYYCIRSSRTTHSSYAFTVCIGVKVKDYLVLGSAVVPKTNNIITEGNIMSNTSFSCAPGHYAVVLSFLSNVRFCRDSSAASHSGCGGFLSIQSGSRCS